MSIAFMHALHEHVLDSELFGALLSRANEAAILSPGSCSMSIAFMHALHEPVLSLSSSAHGRAVPMKQLSPLSRIMQHEHRFHARSARACA